MGSTHFEDHRLYFRRHLVRAVCRTERTVAKALQAVAFVACQPAVHGLPADAPLARDLAHCPTVGCYSKNRFVPLLSHAHLPHGRGVSRRYRSSCSKPAEGLSRSSRRRFVAWLPNLHKSREPATGIEPVTCCLQNSCSAN